MIPFDLYLAFIAATTVLMLIPGPNVALIVANSVAYGTRIGLLTLAGTASAMVVQLCLVTLGMAAVLGALGAILEWVRWIGVAYLIVLGVRQWRASPLDLTRVRPEPRAPREIFLRGLLVSLTNPKTLLFFGAFFPQFLTRSQPMVPQLAVLSVTFVVLALLLDGCWAVLSGRARKFLAGRGRARNRISGGLLIGAGVGLALAHRK
jgi:threonine/homoserine/homoserine lactone efflux protein